MNKSLGDYLSRPHPQPLSLKKGEGSLCVKKISGEE